MTAVKKALIVPVLLIFSVMTSVAYEDVYVYERKYQLHSEYKYRLSRHYYLNGIWRDEAIGKASLKVVEEEGALADLVSWYSLRAENSSGWTNQEHEAKKVKPFHISLHPAGSIQIPPLTVPKKVGMITEFITFFVAISPSIGANQIDEPGESFKHPKPSKGIWTDGNIVILGEDCIDKEIRMTSLRPQGAKYASSFTPPASQCLEMARDWMKASVVDGVPNNFQQIRKDGESYSVMWGLERFVVNSEIQRSSGKILNATMTNSLELKLKGGCQADLTQCKYETPLTLQRELILSLIP